MDNVEQVNLGQLARDLHESRQILSGVESVAIAGVAQTLADTTDKLLKITQEMREQQIQPWVDTVPAAEHVGMSRTALTTSDAPRHYPTPQKPKWNLRELDEWMMGK